MDRLTPDGIAGSLTRTRTAASAPCSPILWPYASQQPPSCRLLALGRVPWRRIQGTRS